MTTKTRYPDSPKITRVRPSQFLSKVRELQLLISPKPAASNYASLANAAPIASLANAPPFASGVHLPKTLKPQNPKTFSKGLSRNRPGFSMQLEREPLFPISPRSHTKSHVASRRRRPHCGGVRRRCRHCPWNFGPMDRSPTLTAQPTSI